MSGEELLAEAGKFRKNLLNFFWRQGVSLSEGEDLVQETLLRLWKYRDQYEPTAKLTTFLFLLARQTWLDALRSRTRRERREER
ncbi:MAG: RNA polymerase subunit sigma-70, partial [Kiritimatiellae bacterium]|nr:RNA polymerase subunit sigma-70 [Kiritimatiellia bacterium]